jgi:hypothetical protein
MKKIIFTLLFVGLCTGIQAQCPGVPVINGVLIATYQDSIKSSTDSICEYYVYMCDTSNGEQQHYTWFYYNDTFTTGVLFSIYTGYPEWVSVVLVDQCNTVVFDTCLFTFSGHFIVLPYVGGQASIHLASINIVKAFCTIRPKDNRPPLNKNRNFFFPCNITGTTDPIKLRKDKATYIDFITYKQITNPIHGYLYFVPERNRIERFMKLE